MTLTEAMNQSYSSPIIESLVDAPSSGYTLIEDTMDFVKSLEPYTENLEECLGPNGPLALDLDYNGLFFSKYRFSII